MRARRDHATAGATRVAPARRRLGITVTLLGALVLAWVGTVWFWQEPFTALYAHVEQHRLAGAYEKRDAAYAATRTSLAAEARAYRLATRAGQPLGWITIPRIGLHAVLVDGTGESQLADGPGLYRGDFLPGEGRLVYVAGHRTTYSAPFANIQDLRRGDEVVISLPYGAFRYAITGHRVVLATDVAVLRSGDHEELILQSCHPKFSATHRWLAFARLVSVRRSARGRPV
ncbi:MAG TPA: class E sortase [Gaiellaceae bacterium]|nr:class E sortase [Gaiellaceae bacterium]